MKGKRIFLFVIMLMTICISANAKEKNDNLDKSLLIPKVTGLINTRYTYDDEANVKHNADIRRVRLGVKGQLHEKFDYYIQAEYETTVKVIDAYFRWKIMPELNVQVGEFKTETSLETTYGPANWLVIENPTAVAKLNSYDDLSGIKSNGRDIGLRLYGSFFHKTDFNVLRYSVGVYNGAGINMKDNNNKKDVVGYLWINPLKQLTISGGYYSGSYGPKGNTHVRNRASSGIEWKDRKLTVRGEYLWGNTAGLHSNGAYLQAAYMVHYMVQPVVSYDYFKRHTDINDDQHNLQIGVNIMPINHLRIQAAYTHSFRRNNSDRNLAEVQAIVNF